MRRPQQGTVHSIGAVVAAGGIAIGSIAAAPVAHAETKVDFKTLHSFGNAPKDGWQPWGSPTLVGGKLFGRTTYGGKHHQGAVLWRLDPAKTRKKDRYRIAHQFGGHAKYPDGSVGADIANPHHDWMRARGNYLFGAGLFGSKQGQGGVFRYDTKTGKYLVLHAFGGQSEYNPNGSLTDGANPHSNAVPVEVDKGKRYVLIGMTAAGGSQALGTLYRLGPDGKKFKLLHSFDQATGNTPHGFVTQIGNRIFGMTRYGAITSAESAYPDKAAYKELKHGNGTIFVYNLKKKRYRVLHEFGYTGPLSSGPGSNQTDGAVPFHGGLTLHGKRLWGMTTLGGTNGTGVIFSIKPNGQGYRIEHTFAAAAGTGLSGPRGTLIEGPDKRLYGLTYNGGANGVGGAFRFNPKTKGFTTLVTFGGPGKPANGIDDPVVTKNRKGEIVLYGMTKNGGKTTSSLLPTPIAGDWTSEQPPNANGTIWQAVIRKK